jgi:hypothetical protein
MTDQPPHQPADTHSLSTDAVHTILRAARYSRQAYPGPIGELVDRELRAYVDTGQQLPPTSIPERLLASLRQHQEHAPDTEPGLTLPARYRKGSPLRWELTPRTEQPPLAGER